MPAGPGRSATRSGGWPVLPFAPRHTTAITLTARTATRHATTTRLHALLTSFGPTLRLRRPLVHLRMRHSAYVLATTVEGVATTKSGAASLWTAAARRATAVFAIPTAAILTVISVAIPTARGTATIPTRSAGTIMAAPAIDIAVERAAAIISAPVVAEVEADQRKPDLWPIAVQRLWLIVIDHLQAHAGGPAA